MEQARGRSCGPNELKKLKEAWSGLPPRNRPKKPLALWGLIREGHEYPFREIYVADARQSHLDYESIAAAYNSFNQAAKHLLNTLNGLARHEYLLSGEFTNDLPFEVRYGLHHLERSLPDLAALPYLVERSGRRPRETADVYAKAITLAVGWYVTRIEHGKFRAVFDDGGHPTSREGILTLATLHALNVPFELSIETMMNDARKQLKSKDKALGQWDIFRTLGFAASR